MSDHALAAQQAAEAHLGACLDYLLDDGPEPDTLAPFCGCTTCEVREVLHAAYPHLKAMWDEDAALDAQWVEITGVPTWRW